MGTNMGDMPRWLVVSAIVVLALLVLVPCTFLLCQSVQFYAVPWCPEGSPAELAKKIVALAGLIVAAGLVLAVMTLAMRLKNYRDDLTQPPALTPAVFIVSLGAVLAVAALFIERKYDSVPNRERAAQAAPCLDPACGHKCAALGESAGTSSPSYGAAGRGPSAEPH